MSSKEDGPDASLLIRRRSSLKRSSIGARTETLPNPKKRRTGTGAGTPASPKKPAKRLLKKEQSPPPQSKKKPATFTTPSFLTNPNKRVGRLSSRRSLKICRTNYYDDDQTGITDAQNQQHCKSCLHGAPQNLDLILNQTLKIPFPSIILQASMLERYRAAALTSCSKPTAGPTKLHPVKRAQVINFMVYCQSKFPHSPSPHTLHVGISCLDRFCSAAFHRGDKDVKERVSRQLSAVAAACLHLASKIEDVWPLDINDIVIASSQTISRREILTWEKRICQVLDFRISAPTTLDFLAAFLWAFVIPKTKPSAETCMVCGADVPPSVDDGRRLKTMDVGGKSWNPVHSLAKGRTALEACSTYLVEVTLSHPLALDYAYHEIAAGCVYVALSSLAYKTESKGSAASIPAYLESILVDSGIVSNIVSIYTEYLKAVEEAAAAAAPKETVAATLQAILPLNIPGPDAAPPCSLYREAMTNPTDASAVNKMAAFIIAAFHSRGKSISAALAKKLAPQVLDKTIQAATGPEAQQPVQPPPCSNYPMGLFASDVSEKHADAARFLKARFLDWIASSPSSGCFSLSSESPSSSENRGEGAMTPRSQEPPPSERRRCSLTVRDLEASSTLSSILRSAKSFSTCASPGDILLSAGGPPSSSSGTACSTS